MATFLGIDYGTKRIGIAIGESEVGIAVPLEVIPNNVRTIDIIANIIKYREVECVVIGLSKDLRGQDNVVAGEIKVFEENLKKVITPSTTIAYEDERYTTQAARRFAEKGARVDASAAALILQSWLDKR